MYCNPFNIHLAASEVIPRAKTDRNFDWGAAVRNVGASLKVAQQSWRVQDLMHEAQSPQSFLACSPCKVR